MAMLTANATTKGKTTRNVRLIFIIIILFVYKDTFS